MGSLKVSFVIIRYGLVELQMITNQLGILFRFQYGSIRRLFDDLILRTQLLHCDMWSSSSFK